MDKSKKTVIDYLPFAPCEPITRSQLASVLETSDREIRRQISNAKMMFPIVNVGNGYYIATDPADPNLRHYINSERHRSREIMRRIKSHQKLQRELPDGQLELEFD